MGTLRRLIEWCARHLLVQPPPPPPRCPECVWEARPYYDEYVSCPHRGG